MKGIGGIRVARAVLMGLIVVSFVAAGDVTAATSEARGQASGSGSYELYRGDVQVGTESYEWTTEAGGARLMSGNCVLDLEGVSTTIRPTLRLDGASLTPISFDYEQVQGDQVKRVSTLFDGGKASQTIEENGMSSKRQLKIKPSDIVVNEDVLYQFMVVAERYDFERGGSQDFTVFDAGSGRNFVAHAQIRGIGTIQNARGKFRTRRLTLNLEDLAVEIYVDAQGRVPMIAIPLKGIEARTPDYQGDAKVEATPTAPGPILGQQFPGK